MKTMTVLIVLCLSMWIFVGCGGSITGNDAPVLENVVKDKAIESGTSLLLDLTFVEAWDISGGSLSLIVKPGLNYRVEGTRIIPDEGFIGDLAVPVAVTNGKKQSNTLSIIISVVSRIEIIPMIAGAWWSYADTTFSESLVDSSRFEIVGRYEGTALGFGERIYLCRWSNLEDINVKYLYYDSVGYGHIWIGALSPTDTVIKPSLRVKYPVSVNTKWPYAHWLYNMTDGVFVQDSSVTEMYCGSASIYVSTPGGTFNCVEYIYSETAVSVNTLARTSSSQDILTGWNMNSTVSAKRTVKLYYSPGVGYVQYLMYEGGVLVRKKSLVAYDVVEQ